MKKKFTTTIDEDVIKQAKIQAIEENTSVAELRKTTKGISRNGVSRSFFICLKILSSYLPTTYYPLDFRLFQLIQPFL